MEYFLVADEHYSHWTSESRNIIKYCNRPFSSIEEMDEKIISNHNEVVKSCDVTIHVGDFTLKKTPDAQLIVRRLNGTHIFLKGSHDAWLPDAHRTRWEKTIKGIYVVADHYPLEVWPRSHYGAWMLHGHIHNHQIPVRGKRLNVGVDQANFYPISFEEVKVSMSNLPDNPDLIKQERT